MLLTTTDVAKALNVTEKTVRNYTYRPLDPLGHVAQQQGMRRILRFERQAVESFALQHGLQLDWSRLDAS